MGYECVSYVVTQLWDNNGHLEQLGKKQTSTVIEAAVAGVAAQLSAANTAVSVMDNDMKEKVKEMETSTETSRDRQDILITSAVQSLELKQKAADKAVSVSLSENQKVMDNVQAEAAAVMGLETEKQKQKLVVEVEKQTLKKTEVGILITTQTAEIDKAEKVKGAQVLLEVETKKTERKQVAARCDAEVLAIKKERDGATRANLAQRSRQLSPSCGLCCASLVPMSSLGG